MGETTDTLRVRLAELVTQARASGLDAAEVAAALRAAADEVAPTVGDTGSGSGPGGEPGAGSGPAAPARPGADADDLPERTAKIGPVTLFNEMDKLAAAGRRGWRVVGSGTGMHLVARTGQQWEYRRVLASRATGRALEAEGWQRFSTGWFPWGYYQRHTDRPAEPDDVVGGFSMEP